MKIRVAERQKAAIHDHMYDSKEETWIYSDSVSYSDHLWMFRFACNGQYEHPGVFFMLFFCAASQCCYSGIKGQKPSATHYERVLSVSSLLQCATGASIPQDNTFGDVK